MWSVCIKFKPSTGWRPYVRKFENYTEMSRFIDQAFIKWDVYRAHVFCNNVHMKYFTMAPSDLCERRRKARLQWLGREYYDN